MAKMLKIKKGDKVRVLSGKDAGREGEVIKVIPAKGKVVVSGINMVKHFARKTQNSEGGIVEAEAPLWAAKAAIICPKCKKAGRVGQDRVCKSCGAKL